MEIKILSGKSILPYIEPIAQLRIHVFREFPYLYDGFIPYEKSYLKVYTETTQSVIVALFDGDVLVGASTGLPMSEANDAFQQPFKNGNYDLRAIYYFGESVLLKAYRGQGWGHRFFEEREQFAHEQGHDITVFCAVERSGSHHLCPEDYRSHHLFWRKRGYQPIPHMRCSFEWKDIDQIEETQKDLTFWIRELKGR